MQRPHELRQADLVAAALAQGHVQRQRGQAAAAVHQLPVGLLVLAGLAHAHAEFLCVTGDQVTARHVLQPLGQQLAVKPAVAGQGHDGQVVGGAFLEPFLALVGGHDAQAVPEMQQLVGHHVAPDHPVALVGIALDELAEAAGEGAAVAALVFVDHDQVALRQRRPAEDLGVAGQLGAQQVDEQRGALAVALAQHQVQLHAACLEGLGVRGAEEDRIGQQLAPRGHAEALAPAHRRPRRAGPPALGQVEIDLDRRPYRRIAIGEEQRIAGGHHAFFGAVGHLLHAGGPGVALVFQLHGIAQADALAAVDGEVAAALVLQGDWLPGHVGRPQAFDQAGLPVRQAGHLHHVVHRQQVALLPQVGLDDGALRVRIDVDAVAIELSVPIGGKRGERGEQQQQGQQAAHAGNPVGFANGYGGCADGCRHGIMYGWLHPPSFAASP